MDSERAVVDILRAVFRLEAERTLQVARLGREAGAGDTLEDVDRQLSRAMAALNTRGVAYPLHDVARRYRLGQEDYLILQLALLPRHGPEVVARATRALGEPDERLRMSHALALIAEGFDDWARARAELLTLPVFVEKLVWVSDEEDPELTPCPAVLELLGLA